MKNNNEILSSRLILTIFLCSVIACNKSNDPLTIAAKQVANAPLPNLLNYQCTNAADYGDSIVYPQPSKNDYIVSPVNSNQLGKGTYFAWPAGLILDSSSGAIDISQSETGLRYIIGFVKAGTTDTCLKNLIIGGITYVDSIYVLGNQDTLAIPYYNANAATPAVCNGSDDSDYPDGNGNGSGDNKCIFDGKDKKGKKGQANAKNIKVRTISGVINLKATLADGAFGANPVDGAGIMVPIAYSLDDQSNKATQQINIQLLYYNKKSDIPVSVVNSINTNRTAFFQNNPILSSARPPVIIITNFN